MITKPAFSWQASKPKQGDKADRDDQEEECQVGGIPGDVGEVPLHQCDGLENNIANRYQK